MPEFSCYDYEYFLQVANGVKKVSNFLIQFLSFNEYSPVFLPPYKYLDITKKPNLLKICKDDNILNKYLPDKDQLTGINREFLLVVIFFYNLAYLFKE